MTAFPIIETIHCDVTEQIATNVISITDGQIYTNANLFKKGYRPAVDSALSVSRVGSSGQCSQFKRLVGTIKNDLTNYRQYVDTSQISDVESDDIVLLKLKGIAIECIYQQDQLDGSPIEEIILLLLLYNKGCLRRSPSLRLGLQPCKIYSACGFYKAGRLNDNDSRQQLYRSRRVKMVKSFDFTLLQS